ncbi:MAG: hypothetical protein LZF64_09785, partial [Nitrosomonas sp.]
MNTLSISQERLLQAKIAYTPRNEVIRSYSQLISVSSANRSRFETDYLESNCCYRHLALWLRVLCRGKVEMPQKFLLRCMAFRA